MISRRNYFIIVIVMGIIFFLFQFSQIVRNVGNEYNVNQYQELEIADNHMWQQLKATVETLTELGDTDATFEEGNYILFVGGEETNVGSIVTQWTLYSKRDLLTCDSITDFADTSYVLPEFIIVDSTYVDFDEETSVFKSLTDQGVSIVFCNLPDASVIRENEELRTLLGIAYIEQDEVTVEGIKVFSGFLLGGETIYQPEKEEYEYRQDLDLTMPWYVTSGGTKTYIVGMMDDYYGDYEYKNDYFPAIIWRNSLGKAQVFSVNGDYMSETSGLGILSSMIYELSDYQIYPVVNAQNTLVINFPIMADENDEQFNQIYARSLGQFQTDVIWPSLITLAEKNKLKYTCFMSPKYDYNDPAEAGYDQYETLLQLFNESAAEVGLSLVHADGISLLEKLAADKDYYDQIEIRYECTSAFMDLDDADDLDEAVKMAYVRNVRTIACDADISLPILSYLTDDITLQSLTSNTENFTYSSDLMLKSIETALGYDNAKLDMGPVIWPSSVEDQWENIYNDMASSLSTFWKVFRKFDRTTLTESDQRVRTFLNLESSSQRTGDTITLTVTGADGQDSYFLLRTHDEAVTSVTGADYVEIEENVYLLTVTQETVEINLKSTQTINN